MTEEASITENISSIRTSDGTSSLTNQLNSRLGVDASRSNTSAKQIVVQILECVMKEHEDQLTEWILRECSKAAPVLRAVKSMRSDIS